MAANYNLMTVAIQPPLWTFTSSSDDTTVLAQLPAEPSPRGSAAVVRRPSKAAGARGGGMADGLAGRGMRQTFQGSFSAVSKPNFASKFSLESSRRDLHNALLCTVL